MTIRYVRARNHSGGCELCGSMSVYLHRVCDATTCAACGTRQCMSNGLGRGQCSVCFVGLLPGWSGFDARKCGYKGCEQPAIAYAERVHYVCAEHISRTKIAADHVASAPSYLSRRTYGSLDWRAVDDAGYVFNEITDDRAARAARYAEYDRQIASI